MGLIHLQVSQCLEKFKSTYKPGRTTTIVTNNRISRVIDRGEDPFHLGRWSYVTLTGKQNKIITLIMAFRVCKSNVGSVGGNSL